MSPEQVMGPRRAGRKLTISGDTRPCESLVVAAHASDLLVHEATFAIEDAERAYETGHATAAQAAGIARDADVKLLALTHFSTRYPVSLLRDEAREIFPDTVAPRDFDMIEIPFAEKGRPELVRWAEGGGPEAQHAEQRAASRESRPGAGGPHVEEAVGT